jgi:hypothetical protein
MNRASITTLALALLAACGDTAPRTQTVVVLRATDGVREATTHVHVRISGRSRDANAWETDEERTVTLDGDTRFPLMLPLTPRDGDATRQFRVEAIAYADGPAVTSRGRVQSGFVPDATRVVQLELDDGCSALVCDEAATCLDGTCVDADVPVDALEDPGEEVDRCEYDNGGCDPHVTCTSRPTRAVCGACPSGFVARDDGKCLLDDPALVALSTSEGHVEPFDADASRIVVRLHLDTTSVMLRPVLRASGGTVRFDGIAVAAGTLSSSIDAPLGSRDLAAVVTTETGATRTYTVRLVRDVEFAAYVKAPVPMRDAIYASTAVSGDTFAVGAPRETVMTSNGTVTAAGAVHVYRRAPGGAVVFEQTLIASNPGAGDEFGYDVQIDGDRMIVSAPFEDSSATTIGGESASTRGSPTRVRSTCSSGRAARGSRSATSRSPRASRTVPSGSSSASTGTSSSPVRRTRMAHRAPRRTRVRSTSSSARALGSASSRPCVPRFRGRKIVSARRWTSTRRRSSSAHRAKTGPRPASTATPTR